MHLRKLGGPRRPSSLRMGRRKSRMVGSATQLRSNNMDDDDEIIGGEPGSRMPANKNKQARISNKEGLKNPGLLLCYVSSIVKFVNNS